MPVSGQWKVVLLDCNHVIFYDSVFSDTINGLPFLVDFGYAQEQCLFQAE